MKRYDETPWWCQLLWPWFGPPWYAQIKDPDACLDAIRRQFARRAGELTDDLAGDDPPGEGYLARAGRLDRHPLPGRRGHQAGVQPAHIRRHRRR